MSISIFPKKWTQQPGYWWGFDRDHPLSSGLVAGWLLNDGGGKIVKHLFSNDWAVVSDPSWADFHDIRSVNFVSANSIMVQSFYTAHSTLRSYSFWVMRNGDGGGSFGRIFDKLDGGADAESFDNVSDRSNYVYRRVWDGGAGRWEFTRPSTNVWVHIVVAYDSSSTSNDPKIYMNGVDQGLTEQSTPAGSLVNNSDMYIIGNRTPSVQDRGWDGGIANFLIYDRLLSHDDALWLYQEPYAFLKPQKQVKYFDIPVTLDPYITLSSYNYFRKYEVVGY